MANIDDKLDDWDSDDFDFEDSGNEREPDLNTLGKIKASVKDNLSNLDYKDELKSALDKSFPIIVGKESSGLIYDINNTIKKELESTKKDLRDNTKELLSFAEKNVTSGGFLDRVLKSTKKFLGEDTQESLSEEQKNNQKIKDSLKNTFGDNKIDLINLKLNRESTAIAVKQGEAVLGLTSQHLELAEYSTALQERYFKKSIELNYKQLFEHKISNRLARENTAKIMELLGSIVKNTGLPDSIKLTTKELMIHRSKQRISDKAIDYIGINRLYNDTIKERIKNKISDAKESLISGLSMADMAVGMQGMMDVSPEELEMMTPEERALYSKTGKITGLATGKVISDVKDKIFGSLAKKVTQTKLGAKIFRNTNKAISDPQEFISDLESKTDNQKILSILGFMKDLTVNDNVSGASSITNTTGELNDIAQFDVRSYNTHNITIPTLLSKILREVRVISTGDPNIKVEKYDSNKGIFIDPNKATEYLKKDISRLHGDNAAPSLIGAVKELEQLSGVELTPKERKALLKTLLEHESALNTDYLDRKLEAGLFSDLDSKTSLKLTTLLKNAGEIYTLNQDGKSVIDHNKVGKANRILRNIHSKNINMVSRIENMIRDGFAPDLLDKGLIIYDEKREIYRIKDDAIRKTNASILLDQISGIISKKDTVSDKKDSKKDSKKDKYLKINMDAMKDKISETFDKLPQDDLIKNINKIKEISPTDKKEINEFIKANCSKSKSVYNQLDNMVNRNLPKKRADSYKGTSTFDVEVNGKNFFDKIADAVTKKPKAKYYDRDGDGDRDGSWRDILDNKKRSKKSPEMQKLIMESKKKKGNNLLSVITGILGTLVAPIMALPSMLSPLSYLPRILGGIVTLSGMVFSGFKKILATSLAAAGGGRKIAKFLSKHKGKAALGAATAYGAYKYFTGDDEIDAELNRPHPVDKIDNTDWFEDISVSDEIDQYDMGDVATYAIGGTSALVLGSKLKAARDLKRKRSKELKGAKTSTVKAAKEANNYLSKIKSAKGMAGKALSKALPGAAIGLGAMTITEDIENGDYGKAALHTLSTALSLIPLFGIPLSLGADYLISNYGKDDVPVDQQATRDRVREETQARRHGTRVITEAEREATREAVRKQTQSTRSRGKVSGTISNTSIRRGVRDDYLHPGDRLLLEEISAHESKRGIDGYDIVHSSYKAKLPKPLTEMSLKEVAALQDKMGNPSAVGKYQFIKDVLEEVAKVMKLDRNSIFSRDLQDKMILVRLNYKRGYNNWKTGKISDREFLNNLSNEFASIPNANNSSRYSGMNGNKVLTTADHMLKVLARVRELFKLPPAKVDSEEGLVTANNPNYKDGKDTSGGVIGIIKSSVKALLDFFGTDNTKFVSDGDSSTNKPSGRRPIQRMSINPTAKIKSVSEFKFCGLPIKQLPAIPIAVRKAGNRKFANGTPTNLIIHNTAGSSLYFGRMKKEGYGTQLWIDRDGTVYLVGDIDQIVYHIGRTKNQYKHISSKNSIGIEMVCPYDSKNNRWAPYTDKQKRSLLHVAKCIRETFGIPAERVFYHEQISYKKEDEGKEGAIIAKTLSITADEEMADNSKMANEPLQVESFGSNISVASNLSPTVADGDSSTNKPSGRDKMLMTIPNKPMSSRGVNLIPAREEIVPQIDNSITEQLSIYNERGISYLKSIDSTLLSMLEVTKEILEAQSGKKIEDNREIKRPSIEENPAINLSNV